MKWVSFISSSNRRRVIRAAQNDLEAVYLSGETGTGKSAIARWIHANSPRSMKPLVLMEPNDDLEARAKEAGDGTLVIQDLERFSPADQHRLVRFIRSHSLGDSCSGGVRTLIRARVIATGEYPLDEFSLFDPVFKDFRIHLQSLNFRAAELTDIIGNLFLEMAHELQRDHVRTIAKPAMDLLLAHTWRGNLRELRNILRYGILSTSGSAIELAHLPDLRDPEKKLLRSRADFEKIENELKARG